MKEYTTVLFDLDNTVLDFDADEKNALKKTLLEIGIEPTQKTTELYSRLNDALWKDFEKGIITKEDIKKTRFKNLLFKLKATSKKTPLEINNIYANNLANGGVLIPGAKELLKRLKENAVMLYAVTNGIETTQRKRLGTTGLDLIFDDVFISESIGYQKPMKEYFDYVLAHIKEKDLKKIVLVGDSLTSDIEGAKKAGIKSVWFNRSFAKAEAKKKSDFAVHSIDELEAFFFD